MKTRNIAVVLIFLIGCTRFSFAQKLVLPGDYPDPSVVKIGDTYWASATTSNWLPAYPLLKSKDLENWQTTGYVFNQLPAWADYYFWAPEISYENGKVYIYYAAHKRGGNLCVGIASADKPEGPYKDHGPIICQEVGSIDAFPMRDENGKLHMIWKEDANSVNKPTPIWMQELNEERTALMGEKIELFRNDAPWEGNLVEGVSMIKRGAYFYAFYAAAGCCGKGCTYTTGVARSRSLVGPWEKYAKNPILSGDDEWKCPGHGTPVEKDGKFYFLYHAYDKESDVYTGREGLLIEFKFTPDDWVEFIKVSDSAAAEQPTITDDFNGRRISDNWQWSVFQNIDKKLKRGRLLLHALPAETGAFLGQKTLASDYNATVSINTKKSGAAAGLALIGDEKNVVTVLVKKDSIKVVQVKNNKETVVAAVSIPKRKRVYLQMQVRHGKDISFSYSHTRQNFIPLHNEAIDGSYLPPWDRAVRAGILSKGAIEEKAVFEHFEISKN